MNSITIHRLSLQFDGGQITHGTTEEQAAQAIDLINQVLQREPFGVAAQLIATQDEIEVESEPSTTHEKNIFCTSSHCRTGRDHCGQVGS
jgi:hypothetical protein